MKKIKKKSFNNERKDADSRDVLRINLSFHLDLISSILLLPNCKFWKGLTYSTIHLIHKNYYETK